jgi:uridylate kinase
MAKKERIILKLSGAALHDTNSNAILASNKMLLLAKQIKTLTAKYEIAIVIGGGNI